MATVGITFSHFGKLDGNAAVLTDDDEVLSEFIDTGLDTPVSSTIVANDVSQVCRIVVRGGDVWVSIGQTPVAGPGEKFWVLDGTVEYFSLNVGDTVSVYEVGPGD